MKAKKMIAVLLLALAAAVRIHAQDGGFRFFGPLARVVTPNGDGINDRLFICFDNFSDSGVSGRIYTLLGADVASMSWIRSPLPGCAPGTIAQYATWDGRTTEGTVRGGLYVYRIEAESRRYSGTVLVVR